MANNPLFSQSYSRLNDWRNCPYQAYHKYVLKSFKFEQSASAAEGDRIHKALEARIQYKTALPVDLATFDPLVVELENAAAAANGVLRAEWNMALTADLVPCDSRDWDNVFLRAKTDATIIAGDVAWVGDWKSGKPKLDETQLRIAALSMFQHDENIEVVSSAYIWLMYSNPPDTETYYRKDIDALWAPLFEEFAEVQRMYLTGHWPAKPKAAWVCKYCPVNKARLCTEAKATYAGD